MNNNIDHIDELIGKYLAGEASAEEALMVEDWVKESDANKKHLNHIKIIFDSANVIQASPHFDTDKAWNKIKGNLKRQEAKIVNFPSKTSYTSYLWKVAATVIIVLGVGLLLYKLQTPNEETQTRMEVIAEKEAVRDTLPNGSGVFLNKKTNLAYTFNRAKKTHTVKLKGEAYFNIKRNESETFLIEVDGVYIRDIGTSFNVKAYPNANTIEVVVEEGEIIFYTDQDQGIHLRDTGKGVYNKTTKQFTIEQPDANVTAYKTKFFIFSGTDLNTVVETLNGVYNKKIVLGDSVKNCKLTVSFKDENVNEIARVIAETLGLTLEESHDKIMLKGAGCE